VPSFVTAALIASETDAVVTLPRLLAEELAPRLNLKLVPPPLRLPKIDVSQHWHERFHRDSGIRWIRQVFATLFAPS
jgi:DNA-binding transcriptional LysR family regulator